ncbi:MAG: hypothetical protein UIB61_08845 [Treponema sp.]|nr:hypothetical protein [Treponema sp.]
MKKYLFFLTAIILSVIAISCDEKFTSTIVVENSSKAEKENYDDIITEIMVSEGTSENYKTVWSGELKYNKKVSYDIDSGDYCIKIKGTRLYTTSGTEKEINEICSKGNPIEFRNCDTKLFVWDGTSLINKGETELD